MLEEVLKRIPQRPPFLFVDEITDLTQEMIICKKKLIGDEDYFKGHFPGNPVMPGVLMQECLFQAAAILMSSSVDEGKLGVATRIEKTKFKNMARPGDELDIVVNLKERLANACYFHGKISREGKLIMSSDFACALT